MQFQLFQMLIVQTDLVPEIHSLRPLGQIRKALILSIVKYSRQLNLHSIGYNYHLALTSFHVWTTFQRTLTIRTTTTTPFIES